MSRKLGGSKLTKPYNRQWLTKNPVELLCRLFKCTPSCERNSNSQSAYRKRDVQVPADSSADCLLSRTTRKDSGHSNRRPLEDQEIRSGPRHSAPRQARPTNGVSGRRRSGRAGSLSNIFKENRLQSSGGRYG